MRQGLRTALVALLAAGFAACGAPQRAEPEAEAAERERIAELSALAYLGSVEDEKAAEQRGVVASDPLRAAPGITVFGSRRGAPEAFFFDLSGREIARFATQPNEGNGLLWMEPTPDGQLIVSGRGYLAKTTWDGEILWQAEPHKYHHGFDQGPDGRIYAMAHDLRDVEFGGGLVQVSDDLVVVLSPAGRTLRTISILDLLGARSISRRLLELAALVRDGGAPPHDELENELAADHPWDIFHLNAVEVLRRDSSIGRRGDLLVCLRSLNLVMVVGLEPLAVRWRWEEGRELLDRPHAPRALPNGNLVVFDNGWRRGYSRVLEVEPSSGRIVWQWRATPPESFYTRRGGLAQPLPNGDLLVTQSDSGRIFELTRGGEIVWEFWNPLFNPAREGEEPKRKTIYRAWRWSAVDLHAARLPERVRVALATRG